MSRAFVAASSQYLKNANAVVTAYPLTIACWAFQTDFTATRDLVSISYNGSNTDYFTLEVNTTPTVNVRARSAATNTLAQSSGNPTAGVWYHACGVYTSATSRAAFRNGANKGTSVTSVTPASVNTTSIGRVETLSTSGDYQNGTIAEVAIWNVALSDGEVAALAKGIAPPYIQPDALVGYWPIWGLHSPEIDLTANGRNMTVTGATAGNHAPVEPFSHQRWGDTSFNVGQAPLGELSMTLLGVGWGA